MLATRTRLWLQGHDDGYKGHDDGYKGHDDGYKDQFALTLVTQKHLNSLDIETRKLLFKVIYRNQGLEVKEAWDCKESVMVAV